jgi:carbon-monoxide dehydrogenase large subunit
MRSSSCGSLTVTAPPSPEMGGERFEADGTVTVVTGTLDYGQGHAAAFAQVLSTRLGVPFGRVRLVQGDSDRLVAGGGTGGSRSAMASGNAIAEAAAKVIEKGIRIAAFALETAVVDVEFDRGTFRVAGTDRAIGIMELAARLRDGLDLPDDLPATLDVDHVFSGAPSTFPNGCHVCEVEVDPETGAVRVERYTVVDDFGVLINPMLVEGQAHGGIVQGIGQALMEHTVYDGEGQLLAGSVMDYALPRAADAPSIAFASHPSPARSNPLGVKGCGEAGCSGALPAVMNAVVDALADRGVRHLDMPATPLRIWRTLADL